LLYNSETKKYGFYDHEPRQKAVAVPSEALDNQIKNLRLLNCIFAGTIGVLLALLIAGYILL